ncbi:unnamed protein product [Timema podura]|uniref:Uncharacterized protein n=1 Tax=Timema podura TaxID=61482 RepID=A0ABN7NMC1_TIMPD|nr:unnamed protein product [Timema podura]
MKEEWEGLKNPKTGRGTQGEETLKSWPFWEIMDLVVGQRDIINLPEICCSSSWVQPRAGSEVESWEGDESASVNLSSATGANLLATNTSHQYVKCVDIYPQPEPDILLAIGQANGKVVLTTFGPTAFDTLGLAGKELVPSHARQCNTVAWNPTDCNLLAAGLEKYRSDHSVLLWDVLKCPINTDRGPDVTRPVAELGYSETTHSLAWFNTQSRSLVVGSNNKHLKVLDLRDSAKAVNMTQTKAVYGLVVDPHSDYQIASFFENQIAIWDTRNFEKPILTLTQSKHVTKVLWCPTRKKEHKLQVYTVATFLIQTPKIQQEILCAVKSKEEPVLFLVSANQDQKCSNLEQMLIFLMRGNGDHNCKN